jgi:hypothetical protein
MADIRENEPEIVVIDSDDDSLTDNKIETKNNEIQELLVSRREFFKTNSVRAPIMIFAEEAVKKFNDAHPLDEPITVSDEILDEIATSWWEKVKLFHLILFF